MPSATPHGTTAIACCGNPHRGDDAFGLHVLGRLRCLAGLEDASDGALASRPSALGGQACQGLRLDPTQARPPTGDKGTGCSACLRAIDGDGLALLDIMADHRRVVVVDALHTQQPAGSVEVLDVTDSPLPADWRAASTHALGVAGAIELARVLGQLPGQVIVIGVVGQCFDIGAGMTTAVAARVPEVAERIVAMLGRLELATASRGSQHA